MVVVSRAVAPAFATIDVGEYGSLLSQGRQPYFIAPNRLSNEFAGRAGTAPAMVACAAGAAAAAACAGASDTDGFSAGAGAGLGAGFGSACFGAAARARTTAGGESLLSDFGFAAGAGGGALAVVSLPPRPTLRARLENQPSDCAGFSAG